VHVKHFLTNPDNLPIYNEVRADFLGESRPTSTLLIVSGLADPNFLVEVEMIAASTRRG